MAVLTPSPKMQFESAAGVPLSGGKVYTYTAGTTTPLATYTDYTGATPNANPIILNSRGEASIWLGAATYKFKLTDANDVEIWTVDYISAPTSGVSPVLSGNVVIDSDTPGPALKITQTGTGPVMRVQDSADPDATPFIIDTTGQVGIGTSTPSAQLEATGAVKLGSLTLTSSPLPVGSGGTGLATLTAENILVGDGVNNVKLLAPSASGDIIISSGTAWTTAARAVPTIAAGDAGKALVNNGTVQSWGSSVAAGTAVSISGSPTTVAFTGIPSWARRVTIALSSVVKSSNSDLLIQVGSTTFATSGYNSSGGQMTVSAGTGVRTSSAGIIFFTDVTTAIMSGIVQLVNVSGNIWVASGTLGNLTGSIYAATTSGTVTLGGALDRIRLNTVGGAETFTSGTVNIFWE